MSIKRSKSLCSLNSNEIITGDFKRLLSHRTVSESSTEVYIISDASDSNDKMDESKLMADSGIEDKKVFDSEMLICMEQKIDRLSDIFLEQCRLLTTLKGEIRNSKISIEITEHTHSQLYTDLLKKAVTQGVKELNVAGLPTAPDEETLKTRASVLLNAIVTKQGVALNKEITEALISFLQSKELKDQMVQATAESVKDVIDSCLPRDFSNIYLPILERSHQRLVRHITKVIEEAFIELEENSACLSKSVYKASNILRQAIERHQAILEAASDPGKNVIGTLQYTVEELLYEELKEWRQKVLNIFCGQLQSKSIEQRTELSGHYNSIKGGSPQSGCSEQSIIDKLMMSANLKRQISEGEINDAFETALSASDLSLVMCACRAVDPNDVFTQPCKLKQNVLLSLIQQLATDMVHDTQIKCRYLEDAIINLNTAHPDTHAHLPLVVGEVQKHLSKFLLSYPNHMSSRRISLIVMASGNLLK